MKIRCTTNSIRLRLRKSDIDLLQQDSRIEETLQLGPNATFTFELSIAEGLAEPSVLFKSNTLSLYLPKSLTINWINSNQVGIEHYKSVGEQTKLHILVEKDFPCLDRKEENKEDTFWELSPENPENC